MKNWLNLIKIILIISIPIAILLLNLHFLVTKEFIRLNSAIRNDHDKENLILAENITEYVRDKNNIKNLNSDTLTKKEINHLNDVKNLTLNAMRLQYLASVLVVLSTFVLFNEKISINSIKKYYYSGLFLTIGIISLIALFGLLDFSFLFIKFHEIFFPENSWLFSPSDTLIQLFPLKFWTNTAKIILLLSTIETIFALFLVYKTKPLRKNLIS